MDFDQKIEKASEVLKVVSKNKLKERFEQLRELWEKCGNLAEKYL